MPEFESPSLVVPLIALLAAVLIPAYAGIMRGRTFAIFSGVILLFSVSGIVISHERLGDWLASTAPALRPVLDFTFAYLMLAAALQLSSLVKARLHGIPFRLMVTWPGQAFLAAGLLAAAWLGVGEALNWPGSDSERRALVQEMDGSWPFFRSTLDLIEMVLAKALPDIAARYDDLLAPPELKP